MPAYPGFSGGRGMGSVIGSNPAEDERRAAEEERRRQERIQIGSALLSTIPIVGGLLGAGGGLLANKQTDKPKSPIEQNTVLKDPYFDPYIYGLDRKQPSYNARPRIRP